MPSRSTEPRPHVERLINIQILRGVAAMLVVLAHSIDTSELVAGRWAIASAGYLENIGAFGVDLFFIISGFVMAFSVAGRSGARGAADFLARRWIRIAPPYLVASAIALVVLAATYRVVPTFGSYVNTVLFVPLLDTGGFSAPLLPVGWTLSFEFAFYLFVALVLVLRVADRPVVLLGLLCLLVLTGHLLPEKSFLVGWWTNPMLLEFALGVGICAMWKTGIVRRFRLVAAAVGLLGLGMIALEAVYGFGLVSEQGFITNGVLSLQRVRLWGLPASMIFLAVVALPDARASRVRSVMLMLGDASYSVYLIHLPVMAVLATAMPLLWPSTPGVVVVVVCAAAGIGGGIAFHRVVERPLGRSLAARYAGRRGRLSTRSAAAPERSVASSAA